MRFEELVKLAEFSGKTNALLQTTTRATFQGLGNRFMMSEDLKI